MMWEAEMQVACLLYYLYYHNTPALYSSDSSVLAVTEGSQAAGVTVRWPHLPSLQGECCRMEYLQK